MLFDIFYSIARARFFDIKSAFREAFSVTVIVMRGLRRVMIEIYGDVPRYTQHTKHRERKKELKDDKKTKEAEEVRQVKHEKISQSWR